MYSYIALKNSLIVLISPSCVDYTERIMNIMNQLSNLDEKFGFESAIMMCVCSVYFSWVVVVFVALCFLFYFLAYINFSFNTKVYE